MKLHEIAVHSMKQLAEMLETNREKIDRLVQRMRNDNSDVCLALVESGLLKPEQMCHAALRYELGKSREGKTIFWMIDERHRVRDGMVGDTWASVLLKERGILDKEWCPQHCLFGLHLLSNTDLTFYEHGFHGSYGFLSEHESHKSHESNHYPFNPSHPC